MNNDPAILFVKPKSIKAADKSALQKAGVIVIELADPANVKLIRAHAEIPSTELLRCAAMAMTEVLSGDVRKLFADRILEAILRAETGTHQA